METDEGGVDGEEGSEVVEGRRENGVRESGTRIKRHTRSTKSGALDD